MVMQGFMFITGFHGQEEEGKG